MLLLQQKNKQKSPKQRKIKVNTDTSPLFTKIYNDMKSAMINKNKQQVNVLRIIISDIKNKTVNEGKDITDDICKSVVKKHIKQHEDSISQFNAANRMDLVSKEALELTYLKFYIPNTMSEDETKTEIDNYIKYNNNIELIKKNMGMLMKHFKEYDNIDMKIASKYLNSILK